MSKVLDKAAEIPFFGIIIANMVLFMDTYHTIYNPFGSATARFKLDIFVLVSLSVLTFLYYPLINFQKNEEFYKFKIGYIVLFSSISCYYALKSIIRLQKTGTSPGLRKLLAFRILS